MTWADHEERIVPDDELDYSSLSGLFAKTITGPYNQHVVAMLVGMAGSGKSMAAMNLSLATAEKVAARVGGESEDYFNMHDNLGIINRCEIERVLEKPRKYNVLWLDDIGVGWNARKFRQEFNMYLNDILQTFRPNNNLLLLSLQSTFLIDKVPRSLIHYLIEMDMKLFSKGMTIAKVFEVKLKHRSGKIHYEYPVNVLKFPRYIFELPDKKLVEEYEGLRGEQFQKMLDMKKEEEKGNGDGGLPKKLRIPFVDNLMAMGLPKPKACAALELTPSYYNLLKQQQSKI